MVFRDDALAGLHIVISGGCGAIGLGIVKKINDTRCTCNGERYPVDSTRQGPTRRK